MQKRAIITRQKIQDVSLEMFAKKGFYGTRMDEIAKQAGVNKQRIYAYFENKENLFKTVLQHAYEMIVTSESDMLTLSSDDAPKLTEILLENNFEFHQKHPKFWRIIAWSNLEESIHIDIIKGLRATIFTHLKEIYNSGQKNKIFSGDVSFETYFFSLTAISFFYYSNMETMSHTLNMDLKSTLNRKTIIKELLNMFKTPIQ